MRRFIKIVLCILCILLLTSTVYGKKKKINASDKLIIHFSREGFYPLTSWQYAHGCKEETKYEDYLWYEFNDWFFEGTIWETQIVLKTKEPGNYDLIIKPFFNINVIKSGKNWKYSWDITLDIYNFSDTKLFTIKRNITKYFDRHYGPGDLIAKYMRDDSQITSIENEFIAHPLFMLATFWKNENSKLSSKNNKNSSIIWNGYSCENNNSSIQDPFSKIRENIQKQIDEYLTPRNPVDINSRIPNIVSKPILPDLPKLVKGQFETITMFDERVRKAMDERQIQMDERQIQIVELQEKYRIDVENRNKIIENLQIEYSNDLEKIKNEQKLKKDILTQKINEFTQKSFFEVMGFPLLENPVYDSETEIMYVDLKASNADYQKKIALNLPLSEAETFYNNVKAEYAMPIVIYSIEENSINLNQIKIYSNEKFYSATLTDEDFEPEIFEIALEDKKVEFDSEQQIYLELQNPNLIDTYRVSAIQYGENPESKGIEYDDDLTPIIDKLERKPEDSRNWLFIIAVENYDETDPVIFSKNSAVLFKKTAQKVFGIKDRNTYALIENDATSGKIKDKLQRLFDNVKEGDVIYFYYSGHGVPVPQTEDSFILPKDKIVDYISKESEFNLSNIYKNLSDSKAEKVFVFIDACFSGKTDNVPIFKGVAPGLIKTKKIQFNKDKMAIITAGKDNQFSNSFDEKGHRMFSYYLIKSLAERGDIEINLLYKDISVKVHDTSFEKGDTYIQEPQIYGNKKLKL